MFSPDYLLGRMVIRFVGDATSLRRSTGMVRSEIASLVGMTAGTGARIASNLFGSPLNNLVNFNTQILKAGGTLTPFQRRLDATAMGLLNMGNMAFNSMNRVGGMINYLGEAPGRILNSMTALGVGITTRLSVPLAIIGIGSVRAMANFDEAITQSMAVLSNANSETRANMEGIALSISGRSVTSARDLGKALFFLTTAGYDANQSIATLPLIERFAVAGMFDMEKATRIATTTQNALGMSSRDSQEHLTNLSRILNVITIAGNISAGTIEDFAESLSHRGAAALKLVNKSLEEGAAVLAVYAQQGITGRVAGERLSVMLRDLQSASIKQSEAWKRYGISVYDAGYAMMDVEKIADSLRGIDPIQVPGITDVIKQIQDLRSEGGPEVNEVIDNLRRLHAATSGTVRMPIGAALGSLEEARGRMLPIMDIISQFETKMEHLSDIQKQAFLLRLGFPQRSVTAILPLLGHAEEMRAIFREVGSGEDVIERMYRVHLTSFSAQLKILLNNLVNVGIEIGRNLAPVISFLNGTVSSGIKWWRGLSDMSKNVIVYFLGIVTLLGPMLLLFGRLGRLLLTVFLNPLSSLARLTVLLSVFAAGIYIFENWSAILKTFSDLWASVPSAVAEAISSVMEFVKIFAIAAGLIVAGKLAFLAVAFVVTTAIGALTFFGALLIGVIAPAIRAIVVLFYIFRAAILGLMLVVRGLIALFVLFRAIVFGVGAAIVFLRSVTISFTTIGMAMVGIAMVISTAFSAIGSILTASFSLAAITPFLITLTSIAAVIAVMYPLFVGLKGAIAGFLDAAGPMVDTAKSIIKGVKDALVAGDMTLAFKIVTTGMELLWLQLIEAMREAWRRFVLDFTSTNVGSVIAGIMATVRGDRAESERILAQMARQEDRARALRAMAQAQINRYGVVAPGMQEPFMEQANLGNTYLIPILRELRSTLEQRGAPVPDWFRTDEDRITAINRIPIANGPLARIEALRTELALLQQQAERAAQGVTGVRLSMQNFASANIAGLIGEGLNPLGAMVRAIGTGGPSVGMTHGFRPDTGNEAATRAVGIISSAFNPLSGMLQAGVSRFDDAMSGRSWARMWEEAEGGRPSTEGSNLRGQFEQIELRRFALEGPGGLASAPPKVQQVEDRRANQLLDEIVQQGLQPNPATIQR